MNLPRSADFSPQEATSAKGRPCGLKPARLTGSWTMRMASGPRELPLTPPLPVGRALRCLPHPARQRGPRACNLQAESPDMARKSGGEPPHSTRFAIPEVR